METLAAEILNTPDTTHVINCVWSLSNIALTHLEMRNQLVSRVPNIFKILERYVEEPQGLQIPEHFCRLQAEIVFFISSMIRQEQISAHHFMFHYAIGTEILGRCLKNFNFFKMENFIKIRENEKILNDHANQFLFDILQSFCVLSEIKLQTPSNVPNVLNMSAQKVDEIINEQNLFSQLLRVLEFSADQLVLEKTWQLIGSICCCNYTEHNVRNFFKDTSCPNLILLIHKSLSSQKLTPTIMKNCIFTLSNIIADKSVFLEQILENNLIQVLKKLWSYILTEQMQKY